MNAMRPNDQNMYKFAKMGYKDTFSYRHRGALFIAKWFRTPAAVKIKKSEKVRVERKTPETDPIKFKISSKTPRGKKDSTKRHHHRHHMRQPGEQKFPIQVVTG